MRNVKGGSHDPQVPDDRCDSCYRARPLDWHWSCPGPRLWRRFWRRRIPQRRVWRPRFLWRVWARFLWRIRGWLLRRVRPRLLRRVWWLLSGLLWVWLFPVLLLLLLIGFSWRRERHRNATETRSLGANLEGKANFGEYGVACRGLPDRDLDWSMCRGAAAMVITAKYWSVVLI